MLSNDSLRTALEDCRTQLLIVLILFAICLIDLAINDTWSDVNNYWVNVTSLTDLHLMPYSGYRFEYPPLALLFLTVPRLVSPSVGVYQFAFAFYSLAFLLISWHFLRRISDFYHLSKIYAFAAVVLVTLSLNCFLFSRYDLIPVTLTIISFWLYINKRFPAAFFVMAVAAMVKLYPAIFILVMLIPLINTGKWRCAGVCVIISASVLLLSELPFLITDPSTAFAYLSYHSDRGIQVESLAASIIMAINIIVPGTCTVAFGYGSDNLVGSLPDAVAPFLTPLLIVAVLVFLTWVLVRTRRLKLSQEQMLCITGITMQISIFLFVLLGKVFSAQYLAWMLLPLPLVMCCIRDRTDRVRLLVLNAVFAAVCFAAATGYIGFKLTDLNVVAVLLQIVKNVVFVVLTVYMLTLANKVIRRAPPSVPLQDHDL